MDRGFGTPQASGFVRFRLVEAAVVNSRTLISGCRDQGRASRERASPDRSARLLGSVDAATSRLRRYQTARIRYRSDIDEPMTWAVGDFYRPDLARWIWRG